MKRYRHAPRRKQRGFYWNLKRKETRMLNLFRKNGEAILIGDNIRVVVKECKKGRAVIGVDAPENVRVLREEILESTNRKEQNND